MSRFRFTINSCCILAACIWITGCSHSSGPKKPIISPDDLLSETCPDPNRFTHMFHPLLPEIQWHMYQSLWLNEVDIFLTRNCEGSVTLKRRLNPLDLPGLMVQELLRKYLTATYSSLFVSREVWERLLLLDADDRVAADQEAFAGISVAEWVRYKKEVQQEITASGGVNNLGVIAMPKDVMINVVQKRLLCSMKRVLELLFIENQEFNAFGGVQYLISEMESHGLVVEQEFVANAKNFYQKVLVGRLDLLINQFAPVEPIPGAQFQAPIQPLNENIALCAQMNVDAVIHILFGAANQRPIDDVSYSRFYRIILNMLSVTTRPRDCNPIAHKSLFPNAMLILGRDILDSKISVENFDDSEFEASMAVATALWVQETMPAADFMFTRSLTRREFVGIITKFRNILAEYGNAIRLHYPYNKSAKAYMTPLVPLSAVLQSSDHHENVVVRNRLSRYLANQPHL